MRVIAFTVRRSNGVTTTMTKRIVYSTEHGRTCPGCQRPQAQCVCGTTHNTLKGGTSRDGVVRIHRETKGRKGAGMTLVKGLVLPENELKTLAKTLKSRCGVGGAVKNDVIELQGNQRELVKEILEGLGHQVKLAGG